MVWEGVGTMSDPFVHVKRLYDYDKYQRENNEKRTKKENEKKEVDSETPRPLPLQRNKSNHSEKGEDRRERTQTSGSSVRHSAGGTRLDRYGTDR